MKSLYCPMPFLSGGNIIFSKEMRLLFQNIVNQLVIGNITEVCNEYEHKTQNLELKIEDLIQDRAYKINVSFLYSTPGKALRDII